MPSIYGRDFQNQVAAARGRGPNWAQSPMGSKPDPLQASLVARQSFSNGPGQMDPMQPTMAAQASFKNGGPIQRTEPKFGSKPGPVTPGAGPSITLPGQGPLVSALANRNFSVGRR